jgi:Fur family peroxide stress response transcriptional regulator
VKTDKREIERRMMRFDQVCRSAGVKLTHQRMEIFREVAQTGDHPDVETVYRALWPLSDLDLITTLGLSSERTRFDANLSRHHHFVCLRCGLTKDVYSDAFNELRPPQSIKAIGRVETTHVEARGICRECVKTNKAKPTTTKRK